MAPGTADEKLEDLRKQLISHINRINGEVDKLHTSTRFNKTKIGEVEAGLEKGLHDAKAHVDQELVKVKAYIDKGNEVHTGFADTNIVDAKFDALDTEHQTLKLTIKGDARTILSHSERDMAWA